MRHPRSPKAGPSLKLRRTASIIRTPTKRAIHIPHSDGRFKWPHIGWIVTGKAMHNSVDALLPYVPELRKDKFHVWISKWHWLPLADRRRGAFAIGGWPFVLWGIFFRTVIGLHSTWPVNSATHMWGLRRFRTGDTSTNSFWVAMFTFGEGWHNNHHASPQSARQGLAWYEFDLNWYGIADVTNHGPRQRSLNIHRSGQAATS